MNTDIEHVYGVPPLEIIDFAEQICGAELYPHQKMMLIAWTKGYIVVVPRNCGRRRAVEIYMQYVEWTSKLKRLEMKNGA